MAQSSERTRNIHTEPSYFKSVTGCYVLRTDHTKTITEEEARKVNSFPSITGEWIDRRTQIACFDPDIPAKQPPESRGNVRFRRISYSS